MGEALISLESDSEENEAERLCENRERLSQKQTDLLSEAQKHGHVHEGLLWLALKMLSVYQHQQNLKSHNVRDRANKFPG
jgi:hypothetical protein